MAEQNFGQTRNHPILMWRTNVQLYTSVNKISHLKQKTQIGAEDSNYLPLSDKLDWTPGPHEEERKTACKA